MSETTDAVKRPPARSLAVDPSAQPQERRQRAMDSPSDPDLGAALGRLPLERQAPDLPIATRYFETCDLETELDEAVLRAFGSDPDDLPTWVCEHLVYDPYDSSFELWDCRDGWLPTQAQVDAAMDLGFARCWLVWGGTQERYCTRGAIGELKTNSFKRSDDHKWQLTKLTADVARLRHLAHQLEICICAAIKMGGLIIRGHRHDDCLRNIKARRLDSEPIVQGFMTSQNRFVDREEAMQLQRAAGAKSAYSPDGELHGDILFSEDLY
jgi:hypothetical protein